MFFHQLLHYGLCGVSPKGDSQAKEIYDHKI